MKWKFKQWWSRILQISTKRIVICQYHWTRRKTTTYTFGNHGSGAKYVERLNRSMGSQASKCICGALSSCSMILTDEYSFCWYLLNSWPSLFKLPLHNGKILADYKTSWTQPMIHCIFNMYNPKGQRTRSVNLSTQYVW
jgi:hypothetical protein